MPFDSQYSLSSNCGRQGWSWTWLVAGITEQWGRSISNVFMEKLETPIDFTFPRANQYGRRNLNQTYDMRTSLQQFLHILPSIHESWMFVLFQDPIWMNVSMTLINLDVRWYDVPPICAWGQCMRYKSMYSQSIRFRDSSNASRTRWWSAFLVGD